MKNNCPCEYSDTRDCRAENCPDPQAKKEPVIERPENWDRWIEVLR